MSVRRADGDAAVQALARELAEAGREAMAAVKAEVKKGADGQAALVAWAQHMAQGLMGGMLGGAKGLSPDLLESAKDAAIDAARAAGTTARSHAAARHRAADAAEASEAEAPARRRVASAARAAAPAQPRAARRTTARTGAKATAARPISRNAIQAGRKMHQLASTIRAAKADDGVIDAQEKRDIKKLAETGKAYAERLTKDQGDEAIAAEAKVLRFLENGTLEMRADGAVAELLAARKEMLDQARADARDKPFQHLGAGWSAPFHGVRTKDVRFEGRTVKVVAIDLADPRVQLQTNTPRVVGSSGGKPVYRGATVKGGAEAAKAEIAINGDFYTLATRQPSGTAIANGKSYGKAEGPTLFWNGANMDISKSPTGPDWKKNAVSGRPLVLKDGQVVDTSSHPNGGRSRRTGLGLSESGRMLYLVAGTSLSGNGVGRLLKSLGAEEGMAMDAGGSAQMYQAGKGLVQASSDPGGQRRVSNIIMVQAQRRTR